MRSRGDGCEITYISISVFYAYAYTREYMKDHIVLFEPKRERDLIDRRSYIVVKLRPKKR